jgi:Protein of unknown function (DUF1553)/Protein of unknown function (DUF1549)
LRSWLDFVERRVLPALGLMIGVFVSSICAYGDGADASPKVFPPRVAFRGPDAVQQLVVEGSGSTDLTASARYRSNDPSVAAVDSQGAITACGDGSTTVVVETDGGDATVPVSVSQFAPGPPVHFANQITPVFTKLGCNSGGCHGKASGQNGFKLSLLGFEPDFDYDSLVKEGRGRRVFPATPEESLLLKKATGRSPHGGGRRLESGSHEYRLIARWIASGMPVGDPKAPTVARIETYPAAKTLTAGARQQIAVTAHYSDGSTEDVTRWAQYQSNDAEVAIVADAGRVEARELPGQAAIMARYQGRVAVFRVIVPLGAAVDGNWDFPVANLVDRLSAPQWKALGIAPSELCADAEFIRRASIDVTGTLPTADEVKSFVAEPGADKRARLIERLLERPEYAAHFATKWADVLRNKRENNPQFQNATYRFHDWIRASLAANLPYDRFVRSILAATGSPEVTPAVSWHRRLRTSDAFVDDTAQVFLGMRLQCAKCHHHPFEKWSQDDYYGFAAYFGRVGRKPSLAAQRAGRMEDAIFLAKSGEVRHPKSGKVIEPKALGGVAASIGTSEDPRQKLVDWMAEPSNPYFARAVVNRYWAHFFGRGLCEPMDDLRVTNPPSNPELLDGLAADFIKSGYDLKHLIRVISGSRVYGLSSVPNETNAKDKQSFARHYPRRLSAEVLLDAVSRVSGSPTAFAGMPAGTRAIELPDESVGSTFLDAFGRPKRDTACECERVTDATLGQSLMMLNSNDVQSKIAASGGRAESLAKDARSDARKIEELFWSAFARAPSSSESAAALSHLEKNKDKKRAFEDILWALVNAKEFQFND